MPFDPRRRGVRQHQDRRVAERVVAGAAPRAGPRLNVYAAWDTGGNNRAIQYVIEWAGTCRELVLTRADGKQHRAYLRFR